jgi:hypothetical protein
VLVVALLLFSAPAPSSAGGPRPENKVPKEVETTAKGLADRLEHQGYEVSRGYFKLYTHEDCDSSYAVLGTCNGNNPAAPYVQPVVQPWPEEYVDPHLAGAFGPTAAGYATTFRFAPREALVILGVLPPPAAYFGLQTYLFTRQGAFDMKSAQYQYFAPNAYMLRMFFSTVPNEPERIQAFSSLSNSNNHVVIERQSGEVWDQVRYIIITPDRSMNDVVRDALSVIGIEGQDVFTEPVPKDMRIGLSQSQDDFVPFIRYAMPRDGGGPGTQSAKWRKDLPLVVLRIRDPGRMPGPSVTRRSNSNPGLPLTSGHCRTSSPSSCRRSRRNGERLRPPTSPSTTSSPILSTWWGQSVRRSGWTAWAIPRTQPMRSAGDCRSTRGRSTPQLARSASGPVIPRTTPP